MEEKKITFFIRLKNAVMNFDAYHQFLLEKPSIAIKFFIKLVLIFSIIITAILTYKTKSTINELTGEFNTNPIKFKFENDELVLEEQKEYIIGDKNNNVGIILNTETEEITNTDYSKSMIFLKNKMILNYANTVQTITYEQLSESYDLTNITEQTVLEYFNEINIIKLCVVLFTVTLIYTFIVYLVFIILDVLILSILGYLISRLFKIKLSYKSIFNISVYSLTLSVLLYYIYTAMNILNGFTIEFFGIAYDAISYIYLITAILIVKSDIIKQQIAVGKIVEEQKKVQEEHKEEKSEEEKKPEEDKKKEKEDKEKGDQGLPDVP